MGQGRFLASCALLVAVCPLLIICAQSNSPGIEAALRARAQREPRSFEANHLLGEFYLRQNQFAAGIRYLEQARALDPSNYNNGYDLALAYLQSGKTQESRRIVEFLLGSGDKAELHNLLGEVEAAEGHIEPAARQYETAARMEPSEKNLFDLGSFLLSHNGLEQARIVFEHAVGRYPRSAQLQVGLGVAYYSLSRYDDAVKALCEAIDINPRDAKPLDFLGKMYDVSPRYADAVTQRLASLVEADPQNAAANYYYGLSLRKRTSGGSANAKRAETHLLRAVQLRPRWAEAHFELGLLYEDQQEDQKAIREYEAATRLGPEIAKAHYRLAALYRKSGQNDLAQRELRAFQALQGKTPAP